MSFTTLALDTSTAHGAVAVAREGEIIFCETFVSERSHNSQLFVPLRKALETAGADLRRVVVGLGPGSYTGVRIGIAAAQALAWARKISVIGLPTLIAPEAKPPAEFAFCGDARRGVYFMAKISQGQLDGEIQQFPAAQFPDRRAEFGPVPWYSFDAKSPLDLPDVKLVRPSASSLALQAAGYRDEDVFILEEKPLEPVYLAPPFITQPVLRH